MKRLLLPQDELIIIASTIQSENLLFFSATDLSVNEVNEIIDDVDKKIIKKLCEKQLCTYSDNKYCFVSEILFVAQVCDAYMKKLDLVVRDGEYFKTKELFLISHEGIVALSFQKNSKEFTIYYESEQNMYEFLEKRLELDATVLQVRNSFNISLKVKDLGKLVKYYDETDRRKFEQKCTSLKMEQGVLEEVLGATLGNTSVINVIFKLRNQEHKNESNAIYISPQGIYLLKTYSDNRFVTIVHNDAQGTLKEVLNIDD